MDTQVIEINGVKLEIDMRTAKRVDSFKVGDRVKILKKTYSSWEPYHGVIVGFDLFKELPTITVCYLENNYSKAEIKFAYINKETQETELIADTDPNELMFNKSEVMRSLNAEIEKSKQNTLDLENKQRLFMKTYGKHFEEVNTTIL